jgi:hypothetical protein
MPATTTSNVQIDFCDDPVLIGQAPDRTAGFVSRTSQTDPLLAGFRFYGSHLD